MDEKSESTCGEKKLGNVFLLKIILQQHIEDLHITDGNRWNAYNMPYRRK